jgi:hypothetical protein
MEITYIENSKHNWRVETNLSKSIMHGSEELHMAMWGIEHNRIHWIVPFMILMMHTLDVRQLGF